MFYSYSQPQPLTGAVQECVEDPNRSTVDSSGIGCGLPQNDAFAFKLIIEERNQPPVVRPECFGSNCRKRDRRFECDDDRFRKAYGLSVDADRFNACRTFDVHAACSAEDDVAQPSRDPGMKIE